MVCARVSPETGDKQLARVKGIVGYQLSDAGDFKAIFGRLDLPDNAYAVTKPNGQAVLRLADSSEIDIGENTKVQVGAFNAASSGGQNVIALQNGALHFNIRHPEGGQSNYKFVTATSQIAVRGTEAFLVSGQSGFQITCVSCGAGDVAVQVGGQSFSVVTGQTLTALTGAAPVVAPNSTVNNPAINQFNGNQNPFNPNPTGNTLDPTNSLSGSGSGAAGAGAGGAAAAAGGAAAAVGGVVAATAGKGNPAPEPSNQPTTPPNAGPLVVQLSYPGASASFPVPFNWPFSQANATGQASINCAPASIITCTVAQALSGSTLNGAITGNLSGPGTFTIGASASGYTIPTTSFTVYGSVAPSVTALNFTGLTPQTVVVTQNPAGTILTSTVSCAPGASMTVNPASGPSPLHLTVTPVSSPTTPTTAAACTLTVAGGGGTAVSTVAIPVNITTTSIGISSHRRKPL
jgi:hypothetical protein